MRSVASGFACYSKSSNAIAVRSGACALAISRSRAVQLQVARTQPSLSSCLCGALCCLRRMAWRCAQAAPVGTGLHASKGCSQIQQEAPLQASSNSIAHMGCLLAVARTGHAARLAAVSRASMSPHRSGAFLPAGAFIGACDARPAVAIGPLLTEASWAQELREASTRVMAHDSAHRFGRRSALGPRARGARCVFSRPSHGLCTAAHGLAQRAPNTCARARASSRSRPIGQSGPM